MNKETNEQGRSKVIDYISSHQSLSWGVLACSSAAVALYPTQEVYPDEYSKTLFGLAAVYSSLHAVLAHIKNKPAADEISTEVKSPQNQNISESPEAK